MKKLNKRLVVENFEGEGIVDLGISTSFKNRLRLFLGQPISNLKVKLKIKKLIINDVEKKKLNWKTEYALVTLRNKTPTLEDIENWRKGKV